jgi:hypothetical protein
MGLLKYLSSGGRKRRPNLDAMPDAEPHPPKFIRSSRSVSVFRKKSTISNDPYNAEGRFLPCHDVFSLVIFG